MSSRLSFLVDRGSGLSEAQDYLSAEIAVLLALQFDAKSAAVHNNMGGNYTRWGRPIAAEGCFRRCLQDHPHHHVAQKNLGDVLLQMDRVGEAKLASKSGPGYRSGLRRGLVWSRSHTAQIR
jgi:Flp pilus assembly protein TadD